MKENSEFCLRRAGSPASFPGIGDVFSLNKGISVIGRNPSKSDIFLDSMKHKALISRLHARIENNTENGKLQLTICDTSLNGTYVNDRKIIGTVELKLGDIVTFGHLKGAVLAPGCVAKQPDSEFCFKLERNSFIIDDKENTRLSNIKESTVAKQTTHRSDSPPVIVPWREALIPDLSPHLQSHTGNQVSNSPAPCSGSTTKSSSTNAPSSLQQSSQSSDYNDDELFAYAAAASGAMTEESDEELFSVDLPVPATSSTTHTSTGISTHNTNGHACMAMQDSDISESTSQPRHISVITVGSYSMSEDEDVVEVQKASKPTRKRRKTFPGYIKNKVSKGSTWKEKKVSNKCAKKHCACPHDSNELVDWVQCDYCHKWYHLICVGLNIMDVNSEDIFNCGCRKT